ncbi:MAG: transcriptional regulator [Verrucomicrobiae bacterium]|nr:transcriptional regulator [Verrucomicrobiae bacterium]
MRTKKELGAPRSRPPLERMLRIHQELLSGKFPNANTLAKKMEVSTKTIHRDIEFMRDRMELPIDYNSAKFGYFYYQDVRAFPSMQITEGELVALLIAEKALEQYRGTNFEKPLLSAFHKMENMLPDTISLNLSDWEQTISFRTTAEPVVSLEIFDTLSKAAAQHRTLRLEYRKPGSRAAETRVVDPYHLANINGEWFLFAHDHARDDIRTFVPARMKSVETTGERFTPPKKFSLEQRLRDSFGVHSGKGEYHVTIRFDPLAADYIREKRWHASQKIKELKDGGLDLSFKLSSLDEVQRWVMTWAGRARVIEPRELIESVRAAAAGLVESHSEL